MADSANRLHHVDLYRVSLTQTTAAAVLSPQLPSHQDGADPDASDAIPTRDHEGRVCLPGTTIAGSLRAFAESRVGADMTREQVDHLLGAPGEHRKEGAKSRPSALRILSCRTDHEPGSPEASTAIDRWSGAAGNRTLRKVSFVDAAEGGTEYDLLLSIDNLSDGNRETLEGLLVSWQPLLGAQVTNGRGGFRNDGVKHRRYDLTQANDLMSWLTTPGPDRFAAAGMTPVESEAWTVEKPATLVATLSIASPFHTGSGAIGGNVMELANDGKFVKGRSLRGVLRSRCEYILRTLQATPAVCLDQSCGHCLTCEIFGYAADESRPGHAACRGVVRILDGAIANGHVEKYDHIAVDRFTGGSKDGALYSIKALTSGELTVTVESLGATAAQWQAATALIRLVLNDIDEGFVTLGRGGTRGYGQFRVQGEVQLDGQELTVSQAQEHLRSLCPAGVQQELEESHG